MKFFVSIILVGTFAFSGSRAVAHGTLYSANVTLASQIIKDVTPETVLYSQLFKNCDTNSPSTVSIMEEVEKLHQVDVTGSVSATAKSGLMSGLIAEGSIEVTVGGGYSHQNTRTYTITQTKTLTCCQRVNYDDVIDKNDVEGYVFEYDLYEIIEHGVNNIHEHNILFSEGSGTGYSGRSSGWTDLSPCTTGGC